MKTALRCPAGALTSGMPGTTASFINAGGGALRGRVLQPASITRPPATAQRSNHLASAATLASWPDVRSATMADGITELVSDDAERLLRRWLAGDDALSDLEVRALNLEEAFLSLTTPALENAA